MPKSAPVLTFDGAYVVAAGCPAGRYFNLDAFDVHGQSIFAMGYADADSVFIGSWESPDRPVRFELRGVRLGRDGYPRGGWDTLATLDVA